MKRKGIIIPLCIEFGNTLFTYNIPDDTDKEIENSIKLLMKKHKVAKGIFSPRIPYKYFFILVFAYILKLGNLNYNASEFEDIYKILKIKLDFQQILDEYINLLKSGHIEMLFSFFKNSKFKKMNVLIQPLCEFINNENSFYSLPRKDITVFSTMSTGKSTFINALLGYDYLPSRNEACTAKIATISDNDYLDYCLGYAKKKDNQIFCGDIDKKIIDEWNKDSEVSEIILEGNLDRISSKKIITVIHDTPGINYSGNSSHKKLTINHIIDSRPKIIICLLDAKHMHTTDISDALYDLRNTNEKGSNAKVLFVINKADSFDPEKESLKKMIDITLDELKKHGFDDPVIIPVSSEAARLFKMVLQGKPHFTEDECDKFSKYYKYFYRPEYSFNMLATNVFDDLLMSTKYETSKECEIVIEGKSYENCKIKQALFNTGIPVVENILNDKKEIKK